MSWEWCLGDGSWHVIRVLCYIMSCVCVPSLWAMSDNLHRTVISRSLLWNSSRFGVIFSIHNVKSLHRILLVHYNWYCDFLISQQSGRYLGPVSISDKKVLSYDLVKSRSRAVCVYLELSDRYEIQQRHQRHNRLKNDFHLQNLIHKL